MKLFGSTTSPYVRRLRLFLGDHNYEFVPFNIFGKDRQHILKTNPTLKIPFFEDKIDGKVQPIFDSGNIFRYLTEKFEIAPLTLEEQNDLSIIDACCDSMVNMMILTRSGVDVSEDKLYFKIQRERQAASFAYLDKKLAQGHFNEWRYTTISLLATVEWAQFRNLFDFSDYESILGFIQKYQNNDLVVATSPKD